MEFKAEITISQVPEVLDTGKPIGIFGPSGHGKTGSVISYFEEKGVKAVLFSLAMELVENMGGIPKLMYDEKTRVAYFIKAFEERILPILATEGEGYALIFDEINQASQEIMNVLYPICHPDPAQRHWNGHNIGKCQIVALGNLDDGSDGTVYLTELPTPLQNRFFLFKLKPSVKDSTNYLKKKYKNIPQVAKYIKAMTDAGVNPRDIDQILEIIQYEKSALLLEAKLGSALTAKILDLQKNVRSVSPAELLKNSRAIYEQFKADGEIIWSGRTIIEEKELIAEFEDVGLSAEEIASIMKGE